MSTSDLQSALLKPIFSTTSDVINQNNNDKKDINETTNYSNKNATASSSNSNKNITNTKHTTSFPAEASTSDTRACAACKYQRKRCPPDCVLAPFFPPDHQKQFLNAHRLFGVRNMMKVYNSVKPHQRHLAIKAMIFEANVRANDPVGGCHRIIAGLEEQMKLCQAELGIVLSQLAYIHFSDDTSVEPVVDPTMNPKYVPCEQSMDLPQEPVPVYFSDHCALDPCGALDHLLGYKNIDIGGISHTLHPTPLFDDESEDIKVLIDGGDDIKPDATEYKNSNLSSEKDEPQDQAKISQPQQKDVT